LFRTNEITGWRSKAPS